MTFQERNRDPKKKDEEMMEAVLKAGKDGSDPTLKEGWSRLSPFTLQFIHPQGKGYAFVTNVQNEWRFIIQPNGEAKIEGKAQILQTATKRVEEALSQVTRAK